MGEDLLVSTQPEQQPQKKPSSVIIIAIAVALVSLIFAGMSWYLMSSKVDDLTAKMDKIKSKQEELDIQSANSRKLAMLNSAIHDIEDAVVTDDFVVNKMYAAESDAGTLSDVILDLDNQPDMALSYNGKGAYSIQDRELRAKCEALIKAVMDQYDSQLGLPTWDDKTSVAVTVKNYEIGNNESGSFALVGE